MNEWKLTCVYYIKSRVPWNKQQLSNVMSFLICVIYPCTHTLHTFLKHLWVKVETSHFRFPHNATLSGTPFYMFWCGGNLEHAVKNDWYCRGREYIQQYVYYTTKLPTQVSIIGIFVRILPKTAIKQQVLAVKECWSSEKILKI